VKDTAGQVPGPLELPMNAQKLCVKLFLKDPAQLHGLKLVPVFQSWIQMHAVEDHLLIDVADYEHVPDGPGTVLVAHEANFSMDAAGGRPGLLYQRKQPLAGSLEERIAAVFRYALAAAARLEEGQGLKFRTDEMLFRIADRLKAPNNSQTFEAVKPALEAFLSGVPGIDSFQLDYTSSPDTLFEVLISASGDGSVSEMAAGVLRLSR
jgi:hypothetical protein